VTPDFRIEALNAGHDRTAFDSGSEPLNRYLRDFASQDIKRRISNCFIALDAENRIVAYYSFAATSLPMTELSAEQSKRLPHYGLLPAGLIGRLAVDRAFQGRGLGAALIIDAALRAARGDPAIYALIVDAKNESAAAFYEHLQFQRFTSKPGTLFLPLATALSAVR
jgi:GNAT superfamily N-acetyltransferase